MKKKISMILKLFNARGFFPAFGVEIEFYIIGDKSDIDLQNLLEAISKITCIQQEKGYRQYEIVSKVYLDVFELINFVEKTKKNLLALNARYPKLEITFKPKPYKNDYGSAMHVHMSIIDCNRVNIFNEYDNVESNSILINAIGGILKLLNQSLYMIFGDDESEFERLNGSYMSPTNVSWGKNNRTTVVRIPDSSPFNRNRRIEFRLPSAQSFISSNVLFLLVSTLYGIKQHIKPSECIYGNANDDIYQLTKIHNNLKDVKDNFYFWEIFEDLCRNT